MIEAKIRLKRRHSLLQALLSSFIDHSAVVFIHFIFGISQLKFTFCFFEGGVVEEYDFFGERIDFQI